jgi:hypothetical protein
LFYICTISPPAQECCMIVYLVPGMIPVAQRSRVRLRSDSPWKIMLQAIIVPHFFSVSTLGLTLRSKV